MFPSMVKLHQRWLRVKSSLWFVPGLIVLGAIVLALLLVELDRHLGQHVMQRWPRLFLASPDGAWALLSAVAGSMITVAGVVFSITIVALALASTQFSARVLRNFMSDHTNQTVLGVFLGIFAYCLVVVRTIQDAPETVPPISVFTGILLGLLAIGVLIYYIHHISMSIQVVNLLPAIAAETIEAIDQLFPEGVGEEGFEEERECEDASRRWYAIFSTKTGYVQEVDTEALLAYAVKHQTIIRMDIGVGEFAITDRPIASILLSEPPHEDSMPTLQDCFAVGRNRTIAQDPGFGVRQMVDIALKGLSPAINDPNTGVMCIHYLIAIMTRMAGRRVESRYRSEDGNLRVITRAANFESMLQGSFGEIREYAHGKASVLVALVEAFTRIANATRGPYRAGILRAHAAAVEFTWRGSITNPFDMCILEERHGRMMRTIEDAEG